MLGRKLAQTPRKKKAGQFGVDLLDCGPILGRDLPELTLGENKGFCQKGYVKVPLHVSA